MLSLNKRRKCIKTHITSFFPNVIANLISEYDYHFNGNSFVALKDFGRIECLRFFPDGRTLCVIHERLEVFDFQGQLNEKCDNSNNNIVLKGHYGKIWCSAILSDKTVVSSSSDLTLKIWNFQSIQKNKCVRTLTGHNNIIYCVAVLQDGRIISGSGDNTLKIWDSDTGNCEMTLKGHSKSVYCCRALPDGKIISGSKDATLKIWNLQSNECELTFIGHTYSIVCIGIIYDHNGYQIVSGSYDTTIKIWNPFTAKIKNNIVNTCELTLSGHTSMVYCIDILPDGRIISGSGDKTIKIWNVQDKSLKDKCEQTLKGHTGTVSCINILQDGRVISGSYDGTILIWS